MSAWKSWNICQVWFLARPPTSPEIDSNFANMRPRALPRAVYILHFRPHNLTRSEKYTKHVHLIPRRSAPAARHSPRRRFCAFVQQPTESKQEHKQMRVFYEHSGTHLHRSTCPTQPLLDYYLYFSTFHLYYIGELTSYTGSRSLQFWLYLLAVFSASEGSPPPSSGLP